MDAIEFETYAKADPELSALLHAVTEEVAAQITVEAPQRFVTVTGVDLLFSVAAYALYRWTKDTLDDRRINKEISTAEKMAKLIAMLKADGFSSAQAEKAATSLLKRIADRASDDPLLKKAQDLVGAGK